MGTKKNRYRMKLASHREITVEVIIGGPIETTFWTSVGKLIIRIIQRLEKLFFWWNDFWKLKPNNSAPRGILLDHLTESSPSHSKIKRHRAWEGWYLRHSGL